MRKALVLCLCFFIPPLQSHAGEIFYCNDGRTLFVDNRNRQRVADDPCVKAWFANNKAAQEKYNTPAARRQRFLHGPNFPDCASCGCGYSRCSGRFYFFPIFGRY